MHKLILILFPQEPRKLPFDRWLNISLRVMHLIGISGCAAGFLFTVEEARWLPFWYLALASGIALCALYLAASAVWLLQLRGIAIIVKVLVLAACTAAPAWRAELFVVVIIISGLIAHAPSKVRGWRWHRRIWG